MKLSTSAILSISASVKLLKKEILWSSLTKSGLLIFFIVKAEGPLTKKKSNEYLEEYKIITISLYFSMINVCRMSFFTASVSNLSLVLGLCEK